MQHLLSATLAKPSQARQFGMCRTVLVAYQCDSGIWFGTSVKTEQGRSKRDEKREGESEGEGKASSDFTMHRVKKKKLDETGGRSSSFWTTDNVELIFAIRSPRRPFNGDGHSATFLSVHFSPSISLSILLPWKRAELLRPWWPSKDLCDHQMATTSVSTNLPFLLSLPPSTPHSLSLPLHFSLSPLSFPCQFGPGTVQYEDCCCQITLREGSRRRREVLQSFLGISDAALSGLPMETYKKIPGSGLQVNKGGWNGQQQLELWTVVTVKA